MKAKLYIDDSITAVHASHLDAIVAEQILEIDYFFNINDAEFYFSWGNEPTGFVSIGMYSGDIYSSLGFGKIEDVKARKLPYHCPYN